GLSLAEATEAIDAYKDRVSLAAINSPASVTLSGETTALQCLAHELEQRDVFCRVLPVTVPYHAPQMEAIRDEWMECAAQLRFCSARPAVVSTVTGQWVGAHALDPEYWWRNVREPVRFADAVDTLIGAGHTLFLELSPHPVLAGSIAECLRHHGRQGTVLPTL